ncbi:biogenesis of lysosome-related organelles complex 1 subunit 6 [Amblyraja radiata]|uniref:biogenesis of lysosome-related organelles complex 1 subunit 6 n=1 Tax=Amblyraja radiata TaxID=386614 RepID=UPI001401E661|nr:biogenesis of lysosome-related organelles complex 1 subunit 6 [Amblyraja radiata]XP_032906594.1 biogenesis of lysosome-related organelles complex 1 subunit 6 [Amblyraja radiata]XP_032906595.1 biogenesis of lysosome-related organelles complex 1 subunit 6 [Amblyraja radiata]
MEPGDSVQGASAWPKAAAGLSESITEFESSGELSCVNQETVEKLTEGLISHYLPDLKQLKNALQELTQNQVVLLDTLEQQIAKFRECHLVLDINALFTEAKCYHDKLVNIRREMVTLHEKTSRLKKRALKLQQQRRKDELEHEQRREKELERERQLIAKPAKLV